jgi:transposase
LYRNQLYACCAIKKVNGRKRHILVDTIGLIVTVMVLPANIQDRDAAKQLLLLVLGKRTRDQIRHVWADGGYAGMLLQWAPEGLSLHHRDRQTFRPAYLQGVAATLGRRTNLRMAGPLPPTQPRL